MKCYAIENHAKDSRIKIKNDGIVETLRAACGMGGGTLPLVLIEYENEHIRNREPSERQPGNNRSERNRSDHVVEDGDRREQYAVGPHYFYESRFAEWKPYEVASMRAEGGSCGNGSEGLVCCELLR